MAQKTAEKAREEESQRIAADFHDGPLQSFISLQMRLEILRKLFERDTQAGMQDLKQLAGVGAIASARPAYISAQHAASGYRWRQPGIDATPHRGILPKGERDSGDFRGPNTPVGLPPEVTMEVLQMLREALHNVQKHASATRVAVSMDKTDRGLEIAVDDNGHGFNFAGMYSLEELELLRLGPASLKRRARGLNADMVLESRPGRGAGIKFRIPLQ